jgi:hypothetical protein
MEKDKQIQSEKYHLKKKISSIRKEQEDTHSNIFMDDLTKFQNKLKDLEKT